jgi:TonB family protein
MGTIFLSFVDLHAQIPESDRDYVPPQIVTTPRLTPPKEALDSGLGGTVRVEVSIDEAGNVTSVGDGYGPGTVCRQVTRPDVMAMRSAARETAMLAKFTPATSKGKPVSSYAWLNFTFPGHSEENPVYSAAAAPPADGNKSTVKDTVSPGTAPSTPADGNRYTVTGDVNSRSTNATPPNYQSPVVVAGSKPDSKAAGNIPKQIMGGVLNGKATSLPKPAYPAAARAVRAQGAVTIQVFIDENGEVFSAQAVSGHPLLRAAAAQAACGSKFSPTKLSGFPVKVAGIITYNFVP